MKKLHILLVGCVFPLALLAEESPIITEQSRAVSESTPKVVILNSQNQKVDQESAHSQKAGLSNQPVVRVMGTPLSMSYADELKNSRREAEVQTEQKIVEKLESSRLRDEQERLNKLFGKSTITAKKVVVQSQPAPLIDSSDIYTEIKAPSNDSEYTEKVYAGVHAGQSSNFTNVENLTSYGSFGVSLGVLSLAGVMLESSFFFSQHQLNTNGIYSNNTDNLDSYEVTNLYQLSGVLSLKYTPSTGRFRPYVGAFIGYNYWQYSDVVDSAYACDGFSIQMCHNQAKSDSVDFGPTVGMDFQISHKVSIGFNMMVSAVNLYNNSPVTNRPYSSYYSHYSLEYDIESLKPLKMEETHWLIASLNAKLYF